MLILDKRDLQKTIRIENQEIEIKTDFRTWIQFSCIVSDKYIDENYKFENQCEKCERINMTENENIFYFIPKRITEEGIKNLKDVNKTYEFYDEYREIIISKKVAQIIKENVPYAKFYPVILDNRN